MSSSNLAYVIVDTYFLILFFASYTEYEQYFSIIQSFYVISKGFLSKLAKLINQLMQPIVTLLKYYIILFLLNYKLSWRLYIATLLFHLLISLITRINPFSGCSHYLEASHLIYDANRMTGFSVMGISIERHFRAICKIIFLLPVLRLALLFFIGMVYLVFFPLYCFSSLVSTLTADFHRRRPLLCTAISDHSFVDWKISYFQRCRLIWPNIVGQWEFSTAITLSSI